MKEHTLILGQEVRDKVTGFKGIITGLVSYLTGCHQALVQPRVKETGDFVDSHWFDTDRIEVVGASPMTLEIHNPGPDAEAPKR